MSENSTAAEGELRIPDEDKALHGAVVVGVIPDQNPRVLKEAARYAKLLSAPLVVVHVDVTRFVTYEDPDGYVHSAPIDINVDAGAEEFEAVKREAEQHRRGRHHGATPRAGAAGRTRGRGRAPRRPVGRRPGR